MTKLKLFFTNYKHTHQKFGPFKSVDPKYEDYLLTESIFYVKYFFSK